MTHKERILKAMRGETPDMLPYTPRFDLWYNSNSYAARCQSATRAARRTRSRAPRAGRSTTGLPDQLEVTDPQKYLTRGIGLYSRDTGYKIDFSAQREARRQRTRSGDEEATRVEYHTPVGMVSTQEVINDGDAQRRHHDHLRASST